MRGAVKKRRKGVKRSEQGLSKKHERGEKRVLGGGPLEKEIRRKDKAKKKEEKNENK